MVKSNSFILNKAKKPNKIYLDYAASVSPNPSSIHEEGVKVKNKLESSRKAVARILGARPEEIIFTSGGTESNNLAIQGIVLSFLERNEDVIPHIITTNVEHPSVLETFRKLEKRKLAEVSIIEVESNGIVDVKKIKKELKDNTLLVSVMYANNEIGTIEPIREIAKLIRFHRKTKGLKTPYFHTDAVQAVNYLELNVEKLGIDLLSLSSTKVMDTGKVGILFKRSMVDIVPVFGGGDQEKGLRPGTENLSDIVKFSLALEKIQKEKTKEVKRLEILRDSFIKQIEKKSPVSFIVNGDRRERLPNNINLTFPNIPSDLLVMELSARGIMTSSKSACKSSNKEGSYVITALRPLENSEIGGVRISLGKKTNKRDIDYTVKALTEILFKLKKWYN